MCVREQDKIAVHIIRRNTRCRIACQKRIDKHLVRPIIKQKSRMPIIAELYHYARPFYVKLFYNIHYTICKNNVNIENVLHSKTESIR